MIEGKNLLMNIHGWSRNVVVTTKVYATRSWYFYALGTGHVNKCVFSMPSHFQDLPRFAKIRQGCSADRGSLRTILGISANNL